MKSESDIILDSKSNKDQSFQDTLTTIHKLLTQENKIELIKYVKEIHNADLAEIIQNLDDDNRSKFILSIKDSFDPEILTYLNDSLRDDVIEKIDIKKLASDVSELDVDDAYHCNGDGSQASAHASSSLPSCPPSLLAHIV